MKENALTYELGYGDGIERVWVEQRPTAGHQFCDTKTMQTVTEGRVVVDIANEDDTDQLQKTNPHVTGDLATGVPTIELTIGEHKKVLTWQEAYNLAEMLTRQVNLALYG